jgi:hypothetical protein
MLSESTLNGIREFLNVGDCVNITIAGKEKTKYIQKSCVESEWMETFRKSIGSEILYDSKKQYEVIFSSKGHHVVNVVIPGDKIIEYFWGYIKDEDVFNRTFLNVYPKGIFIFNLSKYSI